MRGGPSPRAAKCWRVRTERFSCRAKSVSRMYSSRTDGAAAESERLSTGLSSLLRISEQSSQLSASFQSETHPHSLLSAMGDRILDGCSHRTWPRGILSREGAAKRYWANESDLCKSPNTSTLCCTVSHLLFLDDKGIKCIICFRINNFHEIAGMAELADAADSKSAGLRSLGVRLPLPAP